MLLELILLVLVFSLSVSGIILLIVSSFFQIRKCGYEIASRNYYWREKENVRWIKMKRWVMCSKCGVKLQTIQDEPDLTIHRCFICKGWYMTFYGKLLKRLKQVSSATGKDINQLIENAIKDYDRVKKKALGGNLEAK